MTISKLFFKSCLNISYCKKGLFRADFNTVNKVISQTQKYKQFIPWCTQSRITKLISENQNYTNLRISFNKFKNLDYLSHVTISIKQNQTQIKSVCKDYPLKHLQSVWRIQKQNDFQTKVIYTVDFQFSSVLFQLTSSLFLDYMGQQMWHIFYSKSESNFYKSKQDKIKNDLQNGINTNPESKNQMNQKNMEYENKQSKNQYIFNQKLTSQLIKFLEKHPQIKFKYEKDFIFKEKTDKLYFKLRNTQQMEEKLSFQLKNLLLYYY